MSSKPEGAPTLSERDAEVYRELARVSEVLADLFLNLLRAVSEVERPSGVHMLGHAGRELSLGVIRALARDSAALSEDGIADDEKNRAVIARALRLSPNHPSVTIWFKAHNRLVACAHLPTSESKRKPSASEALSAANALMALLWSRIGPFFEAQADIERLLTIENPTTADVEALRTALTRPAVRWDFFRRLQQPGWVTPLLDAGLFKHPPELPEPDEKGRQRWEGWAEGDYLQRMASQVPERVRDALVALPETNRNPVVWDIAARAAAEMPAGVAVTLVSKLRRAVNEALPWRLQETVLTLAVKLAEAACSESFGLARDGFRIVEGAPSPLATIGGERFESAIFGIDEYEAERLIPSLASSLTRVDADKALKFFIHRLDEALKIEWEMPSREPDWDPSLFWCRDVREAQGHHGFKELVAVTITRLAVAEAAQSPERARQVLALLAGQQWKVFRRISLYVLAQVGTNAPDLLDQVLSDERLVQAEYPPAEYMLVLQAQFQNVRPVTRRAVADAIIRGPGTVEELRERLKDDDKIPTDEDIRQFVVRWQRKRLRRFGKNVPPELREIAARLDADESVPQPAGSELELEDNGSTGGFGWRGPAGSPLAEAELDTMTTIAVAEYVRQYTPQPIREKFDSPTPAGLAKAIETRVRREPNFGVELLDCLRAKGAQPTYVRGVLQGLGGAVADGKNIEWPLLLRLLPWVAEQDSDKAAGDLSTYDYADPTWIWAQREALKLLSLAAASDDPALAEDDELWHALNSALSSNATWAEPLETVGTMNAALIAALNTLAGDAAKAFVDAALWNYRLFKKSEGGVPFRVEHFRAGVTAILTQPGTAADAARVRLGQFLPQMILLDREWMLSQSAKMFAPGFVPPLTNPVWGGYITSQRVFDSIFKDLHSWYRAAAQALPTLDDAALLGEAADATWSTTRHLVLHALIAVLRGVAELNDELVTLAFSRSPVADRSHAYWEVFSGWNRDSDSIPREAVERLLRFWTWRLEELSRRSAGERRAESGALGWLFLTKAVPADQVPALIAKTAEFAEGSFTMEHSMWERLLEVAAIDIETTIEVADKIIRAELLGEYPHFNIADVGPVLVAAASSGNRTAAQRGRDLVNLLGDRGFTEFGTLL